MDKVIDGVDVSGCEHYRAEIETKMPYGEYETQKDKCYYSGIEVIQDCKGNKGCIYKQLKRLQAEYDDLHLSYAGCKTANTGLQELNQKLEQENEQLKANKGRCAFKCLDNTFCPEADKKITGLELSRDSYKVSLETARKYRGIAETDRDLYRQALQEIREIAEKMYYTNDEDTERDLHIELQDKINSVIGAE